MIEPYKVLEQEIKKYQEDLRTQEKIIEEKKKIKAEIDKE